MMRTALRLSIVCWRTRHCGFRYCGSSPGDVLVRIDMGGENAPHIEERAHLSPHFDCDGVFVLETYALIHGTPLPCSPPPFAEIHMQPEIERRVFPRPANSIVSPRCENHEA